MRQPRQGKTSRIEEAFFFRRIELSWAYISVFDEAEQGKMSMKSRHRTYWGFLYPTLRMNFISLKPFKSSCPSPLARLNLGKGGGISSYKPSGCEWIQGPETPLLVLVRTRTMRMIRKADIGLGERAKVSTRSG